jgi:hypothetical protein
MQRQAFFSRLPSFSDISDKLLSALRVRIVERPLSSALTPLLVSVHAILWRWSRIARPNHDSTIFRPVEQRDGGSYKKP